MLSPLGTPNGGVALCCKESKASHLRISPPRPPTRRTRQLAAGVEAWRKRRPGKPKRATAIVELVARWARRQQLWQAYDERLSGLPLILPSVGDRQNRHAYHLYTPLLQLEKLSVGRRQIVAAMEAENIGVGIHYEPVHIQPFWIDRFGHSEGAFPNSSHIGERTISLPLSAGMTEDDVADVCRALARILNCYAA